MYNMIYVRGDSCNMCLTYYILYFVHSSEGRTRHDETRLFRVSNRNGFFFFVFFFHTLSRTLAITVHTTCLHWPRADRDTYRLKGTTTRRKRAAKPTS